MHNRLFTIATNIFDGTICVHLSNASYYKHEVELELDRLVFCTCA